MHVCNNQKKHETIMSWPTCILFRFNRILFHTKEGGKEWKCKLGKFFTASSAIIYHQINSSCWKKLSFTSYNVSRSRDDARREVGELTLWLFWEWKWLFIPTTHPSFPSPPPKKNERALRDWSDRRQVSLWLKPHHLLFSFSPF
jgi:hypothetical protein